MARSGSVVKIQEHDLLPSPEGKFALHYGNMERGADQCSPDMGITVPVSPLFIVFVIKIFRSYPLDGVF